MFGIFGKLFGKHRFSPNVSPSKTWEGLIGTPFSPLQAAAVAFVACSMGFLGGLVASAIKRDQGVKDWGHLIEGHGGMMDRTDKPGLRRACLLSHCALFLDGLSRRRLARRDQTRISMVTTRNHAIWRVS